MAKIFSEYAREKLLDLYKNHGHEVGSELKRLFPTKYKTYRPTDCITYALNAMSYAFLKTGDEATAKKVWQLGKHGHQLSKYLVNAHRWLGIYINPDTKHPADQSTEHTYSDFLVNKRCHYYTIPIKYRAVNYRPTSKVDSAFRKVNPRAPVTPLNDIDIKALSKVPFGFGVSRGGQHTWLFSEGTVYEAHWDKIGASLYERQPLRNFGWLSGAIVVPPDSASLLRLSAQLCRARS